MSPSLSCSFSGIIFSVVEEVGNTKVNQSFYHIDFAKAGCVDC